MNVNGVSGLSNNGGNVSVTTESNLGVNANIATGGGNLAVESTQADLNINAGMTTEGGSASLTAQQNVTMQPVEVATQGGDINVTAQQGNATITGLNSSNGTSGGNVRVMAMQGEVMDAGTSPVVGEGAERDIWTGSEANQADHIWLASSQFTQGETQAFGANGNNYEGKTEAGVGTSGAHGALEIFTGSPIVVPPPPPPECVDCQPRPVAEPDPVLGDKECLSIQVNNYVDMTELAEKVTPQSGGVAVDVNGQTIPGIIANESFEKMASLQKSGSEETVSAPAQEECVCCSEPYLFE
jgi:hypothetical protein